MTNDAKMGGCKILPEAVRNPSYEQAFISITRTHRIVDRRTLFGALPA